MSPGQILRQIKSDTNAKQIPVLMLTTTHDPREINRRYALGCNVYMTKPIDPSVFIEAIQPLGRSIAGVSMPTDPVNPS
jgi:CheY-like chemotaxis protein